jgi:hypothetical protein
LVSQTIQNKQRIYNIRDLIKGKAKSFKQKGRIELIELIDIKIDKILLFDGESIGGLFLLVKGYYGSKNRGRR